MGYGNSRESEIDELLHGKANVPYLVKLSPEDKEKLKNDAKKSRLTMAAYFRKLIRQEQVQALPPAIKQDRRYGSRRESEIDELLYGKANVPCLVELSPEDKEKLKRDAKRSGLTMAAYLRKLIRQEQVQALPPTINQEFLKEVRKIGNNINQIAQRANFTDGEIFQDDIDKLFGYQARLLRIAKAAVGEKGG